MGGKYGLVVFALTVAAPGLARAGVAAGPQVLYLNFSDGTETVVKADNDNAAQNRSIMGSVAPYPAFEWPGVNDAQARRDLVRDLTQQINEAFMPYDVVVTSTRPAAGSYTMVLVGGNPALLGMESRVAGVAFMDCDNRQPSNVVFAFPAPLSGSVHGLFSTIAQEAGHALGLQHSSDPNDIMYPRVDLAQRSFQDRESAVASPKYCGRDTQNSHRRLLELVGAWGGADKPIDAVLPAGSASLASDAMGGCAMAGTDAHRANEVFSSGFPALLLLFALGACGRRRGRL
jgi:hypothetical protein